MTEKEAMRIFKMLKTEFEEKFSNLLVIVGFSEKQTKIDEVHYVRDVNEDVEGDWRRYNVRLYTAFLDEEELMWSGDIGLTFIGLSEICKKPEVIMDVVFYKERFTQRQLQVIAQIEAFFKQHTQPEHTEENASIDPRALIASIHKIDKTSICCTRYSVV